MKIKLLTALLMILMLGNACTKNFQKINTNPALITADIIKPSMLFTSVLDNSIFETYNASIFWEYANYFSNQASGTIFQNRDWSAPFSDYQGNLINMAEVVRLTANNPALINENSMARIWKVWLFQQMTDAYGDIPYSQAALSVDSVVNQPVYDTQQAIYTSMLSELKDAVSKINPDPSLLSFGTADILFGGSTDSWVRFGNSLRLRLAIRVRYADATLAQQNINDVLSQPLIDDNSLNAQLTTLAGDPNISNQNPLYQGTLNGAGNSYFIGFTVTQELLKRNDPRLPIYAIPAIAPSAGYRGRPMCLLGDQKTRYGLDSVATMSNFFLTQAYSIIVMNAAEVYFIRAEAASAGLSTENALQMYRNGIAASFGQYNVDATDSVNYMSSSAATLTGTSPEDDLENIIVQKYLAIMNEGTEAWAEWRRTGYPKIWTGADLGSTNGNIPRRLTYPLSEYTLNDKNVTAAASRLSGGDQMLSRFWWDAKPGLPFYQANQATFPPEIY
jgi:hypothetical protein